MPGCSRATATTTGFTGESAMFSKRRALAAVLLFTVLGLTACGLKVGEKAAKEAPIAYSGKGYGCIGEIPERIQSYIADEMPVEGIDQFIGCLQHSFTSFAQLTRGGDRSTYAPEELR